MTLRAVASAAVRPLTAARRRRRTRQHRRLAECGQLLAASHDLDRLVPALLRVVLSTIRARRAAVVLLDETGGTLSGRVAGRGGRRDPGPASLDEVQVPVNGSLLGRVATAGRALAERPAPDSLHPDEPRGRRVLAAPIEVPDDPSGVPPWPVPRAVRGVLAVYDPPGRAGEEDLAALAELARCAAVAVDHIRAHEEAQRLSLTDPLTGLWNYRYLQDALRREAERASRFGRTFAVLALDLDRFKQVNDVYGHPAGDSVLVELARRLTDEIRDVDLAFRQGGEEFVVLLPETDAAGAQVVARRLGAALRDRPVPVVARGTSEAVPVRVTISIGIAVFPDHARTPQGLLDAADDALYAAKAAGRDTYRLATPPARPVPVGDPPPVAAELPVPAAASTPEGELPRAGAVDRQATSGEAKPPRQSRGR